MLNPLAPSFAGQVLVVVVTLIAAVFDIRSRRIPNWLVLAGLIAGLGWNTAAFGWAGLTHSAEGLGLGFALYFPFYLLRARGAGDVKLLAAVGSVIGPGDCFWIFLLTAILGGLIAFAVVTLHGRLRKTMFNVAWIAKDLTHFRAPYQSSPELDVTTSKGMRLPHAAMMLVGVVAFVILVDIRPV